LAWINAGQGLVALYANNTVGVWYVADAYLEKDISLLSR
jgi:hypothetical protein